MRAPLAVILGLALLSVGSCATPLLDAKKINAKYAVPENGVIYALPKGYVSLRIERKIEEEKSPTLSVTMAKPKFVPDTNHLFFVKYDHDNLSSDNVKIDINKLGLITGVTTTTKDPVPAAVREFSDFVVGVATQGITAGVAPRVAPRAAPPEPFKVEAVFDPARIAGCILTEGGTRAKDEAACDTPALRELKQLLADRFNVEMTVDRPDLIGSSNTNTAIDDGCHDMVCYRFVLPYRIIVDDVDTNSSVEGIVLLPNEGPVAGIKVVRRSLVENKFTLTFDNGVLTSAQYDDPSALVGALSIPIDILKAIVSIPSALFQFKIAQQTDVAELNAKKELLTAQSELAKLQLELLQNKQKLEEAQSGQQKPE